jgi:glutamate--cysteine ligase
MPSPGRVGLEIEWLPVQLGPNGLPVGRLRLPELLELLDELFIRDETAEPRAPRYLLPRCGVLSFEPGGQLEFSGAPASGAAAVSEAARIGRALAVAFHRRGAAMAAVGLNLWLDRADVPLQLTAPRYMAMHAYYALRGAQGTTMMRNVCAIQVNLDLGGVNEWRDRWLAANLISPLVCATFANSPGNGVVSARAYLRQRVDPTRSGFPRKLVDGSSDDPVEQVAQAALDADVMLLRTEPGAAGPWSHGRPGFTFGQWLRDGAGRHGRPTVEDLRYHLTTLTPEVRARGWLELRAMDALPARLRPVPVALLAGAIEDPAARARTLTTLGAWRPRLPELWHRAATLGLADPEIRALAATVWSTALDGAAQLPRGYLDLGQLELAERFLDRFTVRGRCPADELRSALAANPAAALVWASEPWSDRCEQLD